MKASVDATLDRHTDRIAPTPAPRIEDGRELNPRLVSLVAPASFEAEQYRALRHRLESRSVDGRLRVVAVTSAVPGEGKTTTAINLAGALAQSRESRVLLIDADLRRPGVGAQLGLPDSRGTGLADAILDPERSLESVIVRRFPPSLGILTAGRLPPAPYEALQSPRLGALFEEARRLFDYVVVDTPPLIPVPDCRLIAPWVDGLLMVVAADRTPRKLVEEGLNLIEPAKMIGLVFNGERRGWSGYYGYYRAYAGSPRPSRRESRAAAR
jgi:capsular exopolysaccharide synthesis family protein